MTGLIATVTILALSGWIGTLDGLVNAAIKAQVTGHLLTQNHTEGSFVKKGQLLFAIDPHPFQAALDQAQEQLSQANGQLAQADRAGTPARSADGSPFRTGRTAA